MQNRHTTKQNGTFDNQNGKQKKWNMHPGSQLLNKLENAESQQKTISGASPKR